MVHQSRLILTYYIVLRANNNNNDDDDDNNNDDNKYSLHFHHLTDFYVNLNSVKMSRRAIRRFIPPGPLPNPRRVRRDLTYLAYDIYEVPNIPAGHPHFGRNGGM
ncbi:hypothetical protein RhiirA5_446138 [Rhizophagus irregularis]|uniref:Uncharacterized protein n=1 Tax=Rhizophagus irregularis TaxID=588596 RepID=A0A2N0NC32_9GLOM|nr:hypothetical protein RhiirA5_446138 [Rhizophagus irregularis]